MLDVTTLIALGLVVTAAGCHATWNLLLKRAHQHEVYVWWLSASTIILALPVAVIIAWQSRFEAVGLWYVAGSALLHLCYSLFLSRSLARSDLSLVYPIARSFGPGLVPVLAVLTLGESVSPLGWTGIASIVLGIYVMAWWGPLLLSLRSGSGWRVFNLSGIGYALLTGCCTALYTIVDKRGVAHVSPFLYLYIVTCGAALGLFPYILRGYGIRAIVSEWRYAPWSIPLAAALVFLAYGLVLTALTIADASYVASAREVGLLIGVALGVIVLKERLTAGRIAGSALIVIGLTLITLSQ